MQLHVSKLLLGVKMQATVQVTLIIDLTAVQVTLIITIILC